MLAQNIPQYSIVNSTTRTGNVNRSRFPLAGKTKVKYLDSVSLNFKSFVQDMSFGGGCG